MRKLAYQRQSWTRPAARGWLKAFVLFVTGLAYGMSLAAAAVDSTLPGMYQQREPIRPLPQSVTGDPRKLALGRRLFRSPILQELGWRLRLNWLYDDVPALPEAAQPASGSPITIPPPEDVEALYKLALTGNMRGIRQCADGLVVRDPRFSPFADKLRQLAQSYQSKAILALVRNYMVQVES